ncbi:MAG: Hsp20 family protein [Rhodospirillales bacterium]
MRSFDFSPLFRSTVGFDRVTSLLDAVTREENSGYPPYNIEKTAEDSYRIVLAVAGFGDGDLDIVQHQNTLTVTGKQAEPNGDKQFLYRGIAGRAFERRFELADYIKVAGAKLANGLLSIELAREVPEEKKPRQIKIGGVSEVEQPKIQQAA